MKIKRAPDLVIGPADRPYMLRWHIIPKNRLFNIYLHHILNSDDERAVHDHPWWYISVILAHGYYEVTRPIQGSMFEFSLWYKAGHVLFRKAQHAHRLVVSPKRGCWTLFFTGRKVRKWGFHCPQGWRSHDEFAEKQGCGD